MTDKELIDALAAEAKRIYPRWRLQTYTVLRQAIENTKELAAYKEGRYGKQ